MSDGFPWGKILAVLIIIGAWFAWRGQDTTPGANGGDLRLIDRPIVSGAPVGNVLVENDGPAQTAPSAQIILPPAGVQPMAPAGQDVTIAPDPGAPVR